MSFSRQRKPSEGIQLPQTGRMRQLAPVIVRQQVLIYMSGLIGPWDSVCDLYSLGFSFISVCAIYAIQ